MKVLLDNALWGEFANTALAAEALARCGKSLADVSLVLGEEEARRLSAAHIDQHYPLYRQLNILRSGKKADSDKMGAFIDAVRAWSNGPAPDPTALETIQP